MGTDSVKYLDPPIRECREWKTTTGENKHYRGDFPLVATHNPGFWDVHYVGSLNSAPIPSGPRFNQILEYNPVDPSEIIGDLAVSWESYEEGGEFGYIFHLHPDATFTDGHPVTAEDLVFSLDRIMLGLGSGSCWACSRKVCCGRAPAS